MTAMFVCASIVAALLANMTAPTVSGALAVERTALQYAVPIEDNNKVTVREFVVLVTVADWIFGGGAFSIKLTVRARAAEAEE